MAAELGELVAVAVGGGGFSTVATVIAMRSDLQNLKGWVRSLSERLDKVEGVAVAASHKADLLEARRT